MRGLLLTSQASLARASASLGETLQSDEDRLLEEAVEALGKPHAGV
jgi:hypothetical protein